MASRYTVYTCITIRRSGNGAVKCARVRTIYIWYHGTFWHPSSLLRGGGTCVRGARRAALYGVADALVRQQGYMLAQIAAEIHAPDLAVGDVGGTGVVIVSGCDEDHLFGSAHHHAEEADLSS